MRKRLAVVVRGIVQGVGFRPHVHRLATRLGLSGFVCNRSGEVVAEIEGDESSVEQFLAMLVAEAPPAARVESLTFRPLTPRCDSSFHVGDSIEAASDSIFVSPDRAVCDECLAELLDPNNRRYRYPFLNCTNCGPRLTIVTGTPYDRAKTTMAAFPMCEACRDEYDEPTNRRFHAQPIACPACGPRLTLYDSRGQRRASSDPLHDFAEALLAGKIGAMKGLGGYHLICDARNADTVRELRSRKQRDEKPFAIMVADPADVERRCVLDELEREQIASPRRPIVLLRRRSPKNADRTATREPRANPPARDFGSDIAEDVAPGNPVLGIMLPYTPLHHLLIREVGNIPLVMTSGNRSDEPIAHEDTDALTRLHGIADVFLTHDRPIRVRCEDSVVRVVDGVALPVRRSRGFAPEPLPLPIECPVPILAVGGQQKSTFALGRDRYAFLSHHLGDLDYLAAIHAFERDITLYEELFHARPVIVARDSHPDYASSRYADRLADEGLRRIIVQHHHAHMAGCMAENGLCGPVIGVAFDGTGHGADGTVWGGEFLTGDYRTFRRAGHLRCVRMPGGERAVREPRRMAVAHLLDAERDGVLSRMHASPLELRVVRAMLERGLNSPFTSSAGRLFDAVAAIIGVRERVGYEGQAAAELEGIAEGMEPDGSYPFEIVAIRQGDDREPVFIADTRPLVRALADETIAGVPTAVIARRFHATLADLITAVCVRIRENSGLKDVVLSGGVFLNAILTRDVAAGLTANGFRVHRHRLVPPGDGGLSLGQLAVAAAIAGGAD
jgi:hydrogenase maturation protein HypF